MIHPKPTRLEEGKRESVLFLDGSAIFLPQTDQVTRKQRHRLIIAGVRLNANPSEDKACCWSLQLADGLRVSPVQSVWARSPFPDAVVLPACRRETREKIKPLAERCCCSSACQG